MNTTVEFRLPQRGDVAHIANRMRRIDAVECQAFGLTPKQALRGGVANSWGVRVGCVGGEAAAMFGVAPVSLLTGVGRPWLLGTDLCHTAGRLWLTMAPQMVAAWQVTFPRLENYVHIDNAVAIRWLRHLGFAIEHEAVHIGNEPMLKFHKDWP